MEATQQLAVIDLQQEFGVNVYGSIEEPFIKCSDLLIHVLSYRYSGDAKWYRKMDDIDRQTYTFNDHAKTPCFNEQGIYWALMKSNKPIAKQFQLRVTQLIKDLRIRRFKQVQQLQEENKQMVAQIEELKRPKPASIYRLRNKRTRELLYVGKDKSNAQNRPQQHITERRKIADGFQLIDIALASMPEEDILIEIEQSDSQEVDDLERFYIQEQQPIYNITMNGRIYRCEQCQKIYKSRKPFEKHCQSCDNPQQSPSPALI